VTFTEVKGMTELNGCQPREVTSLGEWSIDHFILYKVKICFGKVGCNIVLCVCQDLTPSALVTHQNSATTLVVELPCKSKCQRRFLSLVLKHILKSYLSV
jgi:hypothetical protein